MKVVISSMKYIRLTTYVGNKLRESHWCSQNCSMPSLFTDMVFLDFGDCILYCIFQNALVFAISQKTMLIKLSIVQESIHSLYSKSSNTKQK